MHFDAIERRPRPLAFHELRPEVETSQILGIRVKSLGLTPSFPLAPAEEAGEKGKGRRKPYPKVRRFETKPAEINESPLVETQTFRLKR